MENLAVLTDPDGAASVLQPLRRRILERLREADSSSGVAQALGLPRQRVNYHVRELEREGLLREVGRRRKGNFVERLVQATARHYLVAPGVAGGLEEPAAFVKDRFSSAYLTAVAARVVDDVAALREGARAAGKRLATFTLATEVRFADAASQQAFAEGLANAVGRLVAEHHDADAPGGRAFRFIVGGHPIPQPPREKP